MLSVFKFATFQSSVTSRNHKTTESDYLVANDKKSCFGRNLENIDFPPEIKATGTGYLVTINCFDYILLENSIFAFCAGSHTRPTIFDFLI